LKQAATSLPVFAGCGIELEYAIVARDSLEVRPVADALLHAFAAARAQPFKRWLHALGMPASGAVALTDWRSLAARNDDQWQASGGIGPGRAQHLVAFFRHADVRALAVHLRALGVAGF
jgi:DNA ligase (NAD+)